MKIFILGLGVGDISLMSKKSYEMLVFNKFPIYLRTRKHPTVAILAKEGMKYQSLDSFYNEDKFEQVYKKISRFIIDKVQEEKNIVYAVPGNPSTAEKTTAYIINLAKEKDIEVEIIGSTGYIESIAEKLMEMEGIDISQGTIITDTTTLKESDINPNYNIMISQVYDKFVASELKIKLLNIYDDETDVIIIQGVGSETTFIKKNKLYELDYKENVFDHLTTVFVPKSEKKRYYDLYDLIIQVERLRADDGCPWDRKQTFDDMKKHIYEETMEVISAIENKDIENLIEELGDLLFQIVFLASLSKEKYDVNFFEITDGIYRKMVNSHPHIYENMDIAGLDINDLWEQIKSKERVEKQKNLKKH